MAELLFNALKAIVTSASGTMKIYGLPSGQGLDRLVDMALACASSHINPTVQALTLGQSINLHSAFCFGYYCLSRIRKLLVFLPKRHNVLPFLSQSQCRYACKYPVSWEHTRMKQDRHEGRPHIQIHPRESSGMFFPRK